MGASPFRRICLAFCLACPSNLLGILVGVLQGGIHCVQANQLQIAKIVRVIGHLCEDALQERVRIGFR